jgi:hypothetical protein
VRAAAGAGVLNANGATIGGLANEASGVIGSIDNLGAIGTAAQPMGLSNAGTITTLANSGQIGGGGVSNAQGGTIGSLVNQAGGEIASIDNQGAMGFAAATALSNAGAISALANSGVIKGARHAIMSAGAGASVGPITNNGRIIGNVEIDDQASVTVNGGTGKKFGRWTSGTITIGAGNLTFANGNTALGDDISVDGGTGTVTNMGALQLAAPETITGNFAQSDNGVLELDFAGAALGQYGALTTTSLTTLDGGLAIDLIGDFTLAPGDRFDILGFSGLTGNFDALTLDGAACSSAGLDKWSCGGGVRLREVINATSLDLFVANAPAVFGPVGSSPIPEPSTWAKLALGFLGLSGLGLRKRERAAAS